MCVFSTHTNLSLVVELTACPRAEQIPYGLLTLSQNCFLVHVRVSSDLFLGTGYSIPRPLSDDHCVWIWYLYIVIFIEVSSPATLSLRTLL